MIRAFIFDMDGTLVQTERLKALSYAKAAVELCPASIAENEVIEVFKEYVGRPRDEVVARLMDEFDLHDKTAVAMEKYGVDEPWQAFLQVRLEHYHHMADDPGVIRANQWPHNVELLELAQGVGCATALATMSPRKRVNWMLDVLDWCGRFDLVLTRDDVELGKPDPEIYDTASRLLGFPADECLVVEDSAAGVRAALSAGMACIAVTTPYSREQIRRLDELDDRWKVEDPGTLLGVVRELLAEHGGGTGLE